MGRLRAQGQSACFWPVRVRWRGLDHSQHKDRPVVRDRLGRGDRRRGACCGSALGVGGIDVRDANGQWQNLTANNSALEGIGSDTFVAISDIDRDANGLLWIANVRNGLGLVVMDGWPPQQAALNNQLDFGMSPDRDMSKIAIGPNGLKWVGTALDGFLLLDDGGTPF